MKHWLYVVVLATIVALVANSQCYARCLASEAAKTAQQNSGCHQSSHSKHGDKSQCDYDQHSETTSTVEAKVELGQVQLACASPVELFVSSVSELVNQSHSVSLTALPERASPPDKPLFLAISVFRL